MAEHEVPDGGAEEHEYQDVDEPRSWEILKGIDRTEAVKRFPDFDLAYLRAAYVTPSIDDHHMADRSILEAGLPVCLRKSRLLARLSCWHTWNCEMNEFAFGSASHAVQYATHAMLAGPLPDRSGTSKFQVWRLLTELARYVDRELSDRLYWGGPQGKLGDRQNREVCYAAETCLRSFPHVAEIAAQAMRDWVVPRLPR